MEKIDRSYIRRYRYAFQWALLAFILYGGYTFYRFVAHFLTGSAYIERPPMVGGFLPIGAFMSLRHWFSEGLINPTHPSALFIFFAALVVSFLLAKAFCGWICPVGAISEQVYKLGARMIGRNFKPHRYLDIPLRALKYSLMALFLWIILWKMTVADIEAFMSTAYWKVADVKMLAFFTEMSTVTMVVLGGLVVGSLFIRNFWCRYLCPYGALVGLLGMLGPSRITRNADKCIDCGKCDRACPGLIEISNKPRVMSPECSGCLTCLSVCPAKGALEMAAPGKRTIKPALFMALVVAVFFGIIGAAMVTGHWKGNVSYEEYKELIPQAKGFEHP